MNLFPELASSYAGDIDALIYLIAAFVGFWFFVAQGFLFGFIFRYRAKEGQGAAYITGREKHLKRWINIPHALVIVCDVVLIIASIRVWYLVKQDLPYPDYTLRVTGQQWAWTFQHPGPDGQLDTPDDIVLVDELHVQVDKTYHFLLESRDVLHGFSVPVFRLKQDAVPGRTITGWFEPTKVGSYDIQCAEICGVGHGLMRAELVVETAEQHAAWIDEHSATAATAAPE